LDAHCMVDEHFDEVLQRDHKDNWVQIPRRHRLDAENWCIQKQSDDRPPIDYEYIMWPLKFDIPALHGFKWDARTRERWDIKIDDTLEFQGSCWFMTKKWFKERGFMSIKYQGWGNEAEEISMETWKNGGEVKSNSNTFYCHLHKGRRWGRMYFMGKTENRKSYAYSYNHWVHENKDFFIKIINKFMPLPGWPDGWERKIYEDTKNK